MKPEIHAARAAGVLRSLHKLDIADYEMCIEVAMLAGTQLLNVCLHRLGITAAAEDVMHAEYFGGPACIKAKLLAPGLSDLLLEIEMLRPGYVRGDFRDGVRAARRALDLLAQIQARACQIDAALVPVPVHTAG